MSDKLLNQKILRALFRLRHRVRIGNDDFFEMVDIVAIDVVSLPNPTDRHLANLMNTEYSRESPSKVSPYATLCFTSMGF